MHYTLAIHPILTAALDLFLSLPSTTVLCYFRQAAGNVLS